MSAASGTARFGEWTARLAHRFDQLDIALYLYMDTPQGRQVLTQDGILVTLKEGETNTKDLAFATFKDEEALHALASALAAFGVKTDDDHKIQGLLTAQSKHLEDMRALVFKNRMPEASA